MRFVSLVLMSVLAALAGCSSLPRDSGYEVRTVEASGRQEPWQNRAIRRTAFSPEGVAVAFVKLPQPLPRYWQAEFVDTARTYTVTDGSRKAAKPLVREVFRAVAFMGPGQTVIYDAVVDREVRGLMVLVPLADVERVKGQSLLILSSDSRWGMTTLGEKVEFEKGFAPDRLSTTFFSVHPSPVRQVIVAKPDPHVGRNILSLGEVLGQKLAEALKTFPLPFWLRGDTQAYLGKSDIQTVIAEFTSVESVPDILISCTSLKLGPGSVAAPQVAAVFYGIQAGIAVVKDDCMK